MMTSLQFFSITAIAKKTAAVLRLVEKPIAAEISFYENVITEVVRFSQVLSPEAAQILQDQADAFVADLEHYPDNRLEKMSAMTGLELKVMTAKQSLSSSSESFKYADVILQLIFKARKKIVDDAFIEARLRLSQSQPKMLAEIEAALDEVGRAA